MAPALNKQATPRSRETGEVYPGGKREMERGVPRREARAAEASCRSSRDPRRRLRLLSLDFLLGIAAEGISGVQRKQSRLWGSGSQGLKTAAEQVSSPVSPTEYSPQGLFQFVKI
jgi:hypothetical protein